MLNLKLVCVLLLGLGSAIAHGEPMRHFTIEGRFLGWSADGRYAIWYEFSGFAASEAEEGCRGPVARVLDTRHGSQTRYLFDKTVIREVATLYSEEPWEETRDIPRHCRSVPGPAALRALLNGKQPTKIDPDHSLRLDVEITSKRPFPHTKGNGSLRFGIALAKDTDPHVYAALARFLVKRGEQTTSSIVVPIPDGMAESNYLNMFESYWSPDSRHVAIVYSWQPNLKRQPVEASTAIMPAAGPKIALLTAPVQLKQARELLGDRLYQAGHSLLSAEPSPRLFQRTRILALEGHEAAAQVVAALIPGGASVEKQTERTSYHLTIELGRNVSLSQPRPTR